MAQSAPLLPRRHIFLLLLVVLLNLLGPALAVSSSDGVDGTPQANGSEGDVEGDSSSDGSDGGSPDSMNIIGGQPVTVQLGSGFIVGCVMGVVLYTGARLSKKMFQSTRTERQGNDVGWGMGNNRGARARDVRRFYEV